MPGFTGTPEACTCDGSFNASLQAIASASSTFNGYDVVAPVRTSKLRLVAKTGALNQSIYARVNELEAYCQ